jgi:hypothetical protein
MNYSQNIPLRSLRLPIIRWVAILIAVASLPLAARANFTVSLAGTTATFTGDADSDTIVITQSGGLLMHNRFSAGDPGFNSNFDFNSAVAGDQTLAASAASTVVINGIAGGDILLVQSKAGVLSNLRYTPTSSGGGTVVDDADGSIPTIIFTGIGELRLVVDSADGDAIRVDGTPGNDEIEFYLDKSVGGGTAVGFMDQNNATGNGPFQMTPVVFSGSFPLGNDLDVNFFSSPGGIDSFVFNGDDRNETIVVGGGEAGGLEVRDTINGVLYARFEVFNIASAIVNGGGGLNSFSHQGFLPMPVTYFGSSLNDSLTYTAAAGQPVVVDLPGTITQNGNRVVNFTGIGLVNLVGAAGVALTVNGTAGNDALTFSQTSATAGAFNNNAQTPIFSYAGLTAPITVNGGLGTDSLSVFGTEAANTVTVNATSVTIFSTLTIGTGLESLSISTFGGDDTITVSAVPMPLAIDSGEGSDSFNITPSANFLVNLTGGNPAPPTTPGDALTVNTAGTINPKVNATLGPAGYQGSYTFDNRQPVLFQQMETLNPAVPAPTPTATPAPSIQFSQGQYQVNEGDGTAVLTVLRSGNISAAVTVDFATSNNTATAGSDYTATNGTLSFAANETSKNIVVPIIDDAADETSETFNVTLSNPTSGAILGSPSQATVVINDNDPTPNPTPGSLGNIATRVRVETGENVLIGGFIVTGNAPEKVVVRARGPSLTAAGVPGALGDPVIELYSQGGTLVAQNDDWKTGPNMAEIQSAGLAPSNDKESALLAVLPPGGYTVIVRGANNTTGVAIVEGFDLDQSVDSRFGNISTRGFVQTGDNIMIGGFIVRPGGVPTNVAIRGLGPSLAQSGITQVLADPTLDLRDSNGTPLAFSDNWMDNPAQAVQLSAHGLAPSDAKESGIFTALNAGAYTAILRGKNNGVGVGLVELYDVR